MNRAQPKRRNSRSVRQTQQRETVFLEFARSLTNTFPELDLRFNMAAENPVVRYQVADLSPEYHELALAIDNAQEMIYDAVFQIKLLTRQYDA